MAEFHLQLLSNEQRFILAVVAGALVIANRKKADIEAQLAADGYDRMPPSKKVAPLKPLNPKSPCNLHVPARGGVAIDRTQPQPHKQACLLPS